ncbi:hypothetical protein LCGC14_1977620 [marine sediment metagenome]|uniref:Uncharacterized protein n=1 Tax=marine sediment metagenome TaxID=412755 RepID=A0A0F9HN79_9ZZZZ
MKMETDTLGKCENCGHVASEFDFTVGWTGYSTAAATTQSATWLECPKCGSTRISDVEEERPVLKGDTP